MTASASELNVSYEPGLRSVQSESIMFQLGNKSEAGEVAEGLTWVDAGLHGSGKVIVVKGNGEKHFLAAIGHEALRLRRKRDHLPVIAMPLSAHDEPMVARYKDQTHVIINAA